VFDFLPLVSSPSSTSLYSINEVNGMVKESVASSSLFLIRGIAEVVVGKDDRPPITACEAEIWTT
jgi:hypothetical protein